jgi:hypothetical protein
MPANPPTNKEQPSMTHLKTTGTALTALIAILALSAFAASIASAEEGKEPTKILPTGKITFTSKSGKFVLLTTGGSETKCEKAAGTGEVKTLNLGNFHTEFSECKAELGGLKPTCTGEGDTSGKILLLGTFHFWLATLGKALVAALVFLLAQLHYTCELLGQKQLIIVLGCAAALAEPTEKLTKITKDVFIETKSGVSDIRTVLPELSNKSLGCITTTSVNGGAFEEYATTSTIENETFKSGGVAVEVLLMNK